MAEQVLFKQILSHCKPYLSENQHGFFPGRSTISNLSQFTQYCVETLDTGGQIDVIYTDLTKAFDQISHDILIQKLDFFGFSKLALTFLKSYLNNRYNYVRYKGFKSSTYISRSGVPQGSNLGPLLFILYFNDIFSTLSCHTLAYADDVKLYAQINSSEDADRLQADLYNFHLWCSKNGLILNPDKCVYMQLTRRKASIPSIYSLEAIVLAKVDTHKDVGVLFDTTLSFSNHVSQICTTTAKTLGCIIRMAKELHTKEVVILLFNAFVRSGLEYASVVWYPHYASQKNALELIQRRFLKYLTFRLTDNYPSRSIDYNYLLELHSTDSRSTRREQSSALFMQKLLNNKVDSPYLLNKINFRVPQSNSRNMKTFYNSQTRTNLAFKAPLAHMSVNTDHYYPDPFWVHNC